MLAAGWLRLQNSLSKCQELTTGCRRPDDVHHNLGFRAPNIYSEKHRLLRRECQASVAHAALLGLALDERSGSNPGEKNALTGPQCPVPANHDERWQGRREKDGLHQKTLRKRR